MSYTWADRAAATQAKIGLEWAILLGSKLVK